ncbi:MAG: hypothetical protein A4E28_03085 [Methanocella sp. PtaU1.Bin125]|nr:MAG: hypothetical protein A4E28_03085 [Methanocella sp. PtaU1.Bin125]
MPANIDLKDIERKAYTSFHKDGIVDIVIGFCAIVFGIIFYYEPAMYFFFIGLFIAATPMYILMKNSITVPRIGLVRFKPERQERIRQLLLVIVSITVLAVILTNAFWVMSMMKALPRSLIDFLDHYYMIYFGVILSAILVIGAYLAELRRFYAYGLATLVAFTSLHFIDVPGKLGLGLAIPGLVMLLYGIVMLLKFLRDYPIVKGSTAGSAGGH